MKHKLLCLAFTLALLAPGSTHALFCFDSPCNTVFQEANIFPAWYQKESSCSVPLLGLRNVSCVFNGSFSDREIISDSFSGTAHVEYRYEQVRIEGLPAHIRYRAVSGTDMPLCDSWTWRWKYVDMCFDGWCPRVEIERPICDY